MRCVLGDETGLVKVFDVDIQKRKQKLVPVIWGKQDMARSVEAMCWAGPREDPFSMFVNIAKSGAVETWNARTGHVVTSMQASGRIKGAPSIILHGDRKLITCTEEGEVQLVPWDDEGKFSPKEANGFKVPQDVMRMKLEMGCQRTIATGGKEHLLRV